jgi:hypothetical protein
MSSARPATCEDCGSQLSHGQRYCLDCGERVAPQSPQLLELLRGVRGQHREAASGIDAAANAGAIAAARAQPVEQGDETPPSDRSPIHGLVERISALTVPSARVCALLVAVFLGFGVLLGNVAGSRVDDSLAASAHHLKLLLPAAASASSTTSAAAPPSEPPPAAAEPTPEASALPTAPATQPASPAPAHSSAPSSRSGSSVTSSGSGSRPGSAPGQGGSSAPASGNGSAAKLPAVKHVFVIMLSDEPYAAVFGPSSGAHYLSHTLERRGELLVRYYGVAHQQLANRIALVSGQGPTPATAANCPLYSAVVPASVGGQQQVTGEGCVYPRSTQTLGGQLTAKHLSWRAYVQGIDEPGATAGACAHPSLGAADASSEQSAAGAPYATSRNPFVYFRSVTDAPDCAADDVGLNRLAPDLASAGGAPSFSYIVPDRCHDGEPGPCAGGAPGGLPAADGFLEGVVPKILSSRAYKQGGLLLITVDQAPSSGEFTDSSSCCGQPRFPNLPAPTGVAAALPPEGGGQVGALLLSPFVKGGTTNQEPYNHFSLLRTIEDLFGLEHLGYAGAPKVNSLEPSLFSAGPAG